MFSANMVRQYSFLNQLMTDLENDPSKVCEQIICKAPRSENDGSKKKFKHYIYSMFAVLKSCYKLTPFAYMYDR